MAAPTLTNTEKGARLAAWILIGVDVGLLISVAILTWIEAGSPRTKDDLLLRPWSDESRNLVAALSVSLILTWIVLFMATRRSRWSLAMITAGGLAVVAVVLNVATYAACAQGLRQWTGMLGWILYTFTGAVESDSSAGTPCAAHFAPGSQLARAAALLAIFAGAVAAFTLLWRQPFDRLSAFFAGDVDVVVGLNARSMPLIEALTEENSTRRRREEWIGSFRWRDWRDYSHRRTKVVVFDSGTDKELRDEARLWGAIVLPAASGDVETLRGILGRGTPYWPWHQKDGKTVPYWPWRRRAAVRRFYAVDDSVQVNAQAYHDAVEVLLDPDLERRPDTVVPRVSLRLDSARDAREWRIREISERLAGPRAQGVATNLDDRVPYYSDALCSERLMAADIVETVMSPYSGQFPSAGPTTVWVYGEGTMPLALAEEFAWQLWARYEVRAQAVLNAAADSLVANKMLLTLMFAEHDESDSISDWAAKVEQERKHAIRRCREAADNVLSTKDDLTSEYWRPRLRKMVFLGPGSDARAREWRETRSPYQLPSWASWFCAKHTGPGLSGGRGFSNLDIFEVVAESPAKASALDVEESLRRKALDRPGRHMFVFVGGTPEEEAVARRLSYLRNSDGRPAAQVFLFDPSVEGIAMRPGAFGDAARVGSRTSGSAAADRARGDDASTRLAGLHRFGPTLVRRVHGEPMRPSDLATRLAHQQHRCYRGEWDSGSSETRNSDTPKERKPKKAAGAPWADLGPFFRQENISQVWSVLQFFAGNGWRWDRVGKSARSTEFGDIDRDFGAAQAEVAAQEASVAALDDARRDLALLAKNEHERWSNLRTDMCGWRAVKTAGLRDDSKRKHHLLVEWDDLKDTDKDYNRRLLLMILARLYAIGVVPVWVASGRKEK